MSDSMERNKTERLRAREIEEEEMKRELTGIGIYEPGITYKQMKEILGFLNVSSNTSKDASPNKNTSNKTKHTDDECTSENVIDTNSSQESVVQERIPSYSYRQSSSRISSTTRERINDRYISSPDSPLFDAQNSVYNKPKSSTSDEMIENQHESINSTQNVNHLPLKLGNVLREYQNMAELRMDEQGEHNQKLDRWQLNPLDVCINENDVPLQQPNRPLTRERVPLKFCKEAYKTEQVDEIIQALSLHLKKNAELWYSWHSPTNSKFQWGSPIQVGIANGSLDKKPLTDLKTEQIKTEYTCEDSQVRRSKRKAAFTIANLKELSSEDEDDQCNISCVKKKKTYSDEEWNNADHLDEHAKISSNKTSTNLVAYGECSIDDDNSNDDLRSSGLIKRIDKGNECLIESSDIFTYPRRIVPPNPKARPSLSKPRKNNISKLSRKTQSNNDNKNVEQMKNRKKDNTMTDEDIRLKLEEDSDEEDAVITAKEDIEIRPMPLSKEIRAKLHEKQLLNRKVKTNRDIKMTSKKEEIERQKEEKERIEERKKENKSCKVENDNVDCGLLSDENESSKVNPAYDMQNGNQHDDVSTSMNYINCPICNRLFPHHQIEDHAADCNQFDINNEEDDNNQLLECQFCKNYKTIDVIKYDKHVDRCKKDRPDKGISRDPEDIDIDTIPTSSFPSYTPISEQKDSDIDYTCQFSPQNKTRTNSSKKRRH